MVWEVQDRHGLFYEILGEEKIKEDFNVCRCKKEQLKCLLDIFEPKDIFNYDKKRLYYKLLLDRSIIMKCGIGHGAKRTKQRITVLVAAYMIGIEKLPLLIIKQSPKTKCFKGVRSFPAIYKINNKALMTKDIFQEWLIDLDWKNAFK